jgi:DNA topoisomerase IA
MARDYIGDVRRRLPAREAQLLQELEQGAQEAHEAIRPTDAARTPDQVSKA